MYIIIDAYEKEKLLSFAISVLNIYGTVEHLRRIEIEDTSDKKMVYIKI